MRIFCLATVAFMALSSVAAAQAPAPAAPAVGAAAKLTSAEVKALKARLGVIENELFRVLRADFPKIAGTVNADSATMLVETGEVYTMEPWNDKHRALAAERNEIVARLIASGEKMPAPRRSRLAPAPYQSTALRAAATRPAPDTTKAFDR